LRCSSRLFEPCPSVRGFFERVPTVRVRRKGRATRQQSRYCPGRCLAECRRQAPVLNKHRSPCKRTRSAVGRGSQRLILNKPTEWSPPVTGGRCKLSSMTFVYRRSTAASGPGRPEAGGAAAPENGHVWPVRGRFGPVGVFPGERAQTTPVLSAGFRQLTIGNFLIAESFLRRCVMQRSMSVVRHQT
jgi:hypothetical protein